MRRIDTQLMKASADVRALLGWPRELRAAPWRESLAPADTWERLDLAVEGLSRARTGLSVIAISQAFGKLSAAAFELADAVDRTRQRARAAGAA
jgi:hypothetical protein